MKELKPMLQEGGPESMLRLLRAASLDAPTDPEEKRQRLLAAALAVSATHAPPPAKYGWWFAGGAVVSVAFVTMWSSLSGTTMKAEVPRVQHAPVSVAAPADTDWVALPVENAPIESVPAVSASLHRPAPSASLAPAPAGDPLALIDDARQQLAGHPQGTLDRVQQYRAQFPAAAYRDEADALEIQALLRLGRDDRARALGTQFLQERPSSPQAARIRRLLGAHP